MHPHINDAVFKTFPLLESDRLLLRSFETGDSDDFFKIRSNKAVMEHMDSKPLASTNDAEKAIRENQLLFEEKKGFTWALIEKKEHTFLGYFSIWRIERVHARAEIGYALKPSYWGKGYMKEAMTTILSFAFNDANIHSIEANLNPHNTASEHLLKAVGFKKEA
ncbi:MAG: GNAT family N-acetyltransferase, partial [Eudoraea sp.]|nr:GNAT family N-acetyltransferase [Eudoraea sp.]